MTLVIDATVGGASANSFCLLAEATSYMESRLNGSTWTSATTDDQNRALVEATRELSVKGWCGSPSSSTQALAWPRQWAPNPDATWAVTYYDSSIVPQRVKDAASELAFQFIKAGTTDLAVVDPNAGVIQKTVNILTTIWDINRRPTGLNAYPRVMNYIRPLLAAGGNSVPLIRG